MSTTRAGLRAVHRLDYRPPDFLVEEVRLDVEIRERTRVTADLQLRRNPAGQPGAALRLDGRELELIELRLDDRVLGAGDYARDEAGLRIAGLPQRCRLHVVTEIDPERNTSLEGLYRSGPMLCTQCEAHGFSRITYYPDRPDVLARFTVRIEADRARFPVLLANGEPAGRGDAGGGRHWALWQDPFPKPCYLFALVAGDLACVQDRYVTGSGREVTLRFYVDHGNEARVPFAMAALQRAMRWDERVYGLEYDLNTYMVVAARDFNMGAMENKGLNLFNARYVLASPETATDADFDGVESVIAHEYFHNWTGNRVTCRDWFQLSLKEGLTVFRDQSFSADQHSRDVQRIHEARALRTLQFVEDAGPMAHPVRPDSYVEINNFYTATVYEKGAEIIRMIATLLGEQAFIRGVRRYLREHDGQAATIEDFLQAQEAESGRRLDGFRRWYSQAGTPVVTASDAYDTASGDYELRLRQQTPPTPGQPEKHPLPIPIRFALRGPDGRRLCGRGAADLQREQELILLEDEGLALRFPALGVRPTPSFLLGFSAPVKLEYAYSADQLGLLLLHEEDGFARWEAAQRLMLLALPELLDGDTPGEHTRLLLRALQDLAAQPPEDRALLAELLRLPPESDPAAQFQPLDAPRLAVARDRLRRAIADALAGALAQWAATAPTEPGAHCAAQRRLSNLALWYLAATGSEAVLEQCRRRAESPNMTLAHGALVALNDADHPLRSEALGRFCERWRADPLVLDKWFALEAMSALPGGVERVARLLAHPDYSPNPNRVRAVLLSFWRENPRAFHRADGAGYRLYAQQLAELDRGNPQLAARLADALLGWRRLVAPQSGLLREVVMQLSSLPLSADMREKLEKAVEN